MKPKKIAATLCVMAICAAMMTVPAFAATSQPYAICPKTDCALAGNHEHDGTMYACHHNADGHEYHNRGHLAGTGHKAGNHSGGGHGGNHKR
ncbi:MAG: hypothetical protein LBV27_08600 [Oscillospiraceae bacterium]|jgi:hypothetical protein|nr:hypothetical protein [Oscillospiraceae bacterium]